MFYLTDSINEATTYNYQHIKKLISNSNMREHNLNMYWAFNVPIMYSLETYDIDDNENIIRISPEDIFNYGLFDKKHHKPLWKNNDFFLYYLSSRVEADFYIVIEGDYFINDANYFNILFEKINNIDFLVANYWETPSDSNYFWKNYSDNKELGYLPPYYLTSKNIMGATKKIVDTLTNIRKHQSMLTKQGIKIPNDNYFLGMELVKNKELTGLFMNKLIPDMKLSWNDSKYYLDTQVIEFKGTIHPVRSAQEAIHSNIQKKSITISDFLNENSYLNKLLINIAKKENSNFYIKYEDVSLLLSNLDDKDKLMILSLLQTKHLLPNIQTNRFNNNLFEYISNDVKNKIGVALYTRYSNNQYPSQINFNNVALFKSVTLSSTFNHSGGSLFTDGNFNPSKYKDGGFHTNWEEYPFVIIDLATVFSINCIRISHRNGYFNRTKDLKILTSTDKEKWEELSNSSLLNINWANLKTISNRNSLGVEWNLTISFDKRKVRFIKIINITSGNNPLHLNQIEVFC